MEPSLNPRAGLVGKDPSGQGGSFFVPRAPVLAAVLLASGTSPVVAQVPGSGSQEVVVTGRRPPMSPPLRVVGSGELPSYGADSVGELLERIRSESGDRGSRATFLINGQRVTGLGDVDSYPAEAVDRIEVLPRESGAEVGAPAGDRVYNMVLKAETLVAVARGRFRGTTEGGGEGATGEGSLTRIRRPQRLNLKLLLRRDQALLESERDVLQPAGSAADLGRFRTLRPDSRSAELRVSAADRLLPWLDGLLTLSANNVRNLSLLGLGEGGIGLARSGRTRTIDLNSQLAAQRGNWAFTLDGSVRESRLRNASTGGNGLDRVSSHTRFSRLELLAHGPLLSLPAGNVHLSLGAAVRRDSLRGLGVGGERTNFADGAREVRAGVDLPLSSRTSAWNKLGDLAARFEFREGRSADYGAIHDRSLSLRWSPGAWLFLTVQENRSRSAPGVQLVGEVPIETAGLRIFDPVRRETVDVLAISGGTGDLPPQASVTRRLTADVRPVPALDLQVTAEYVATRLRNGISALPPPSDIVVGLFPERFERDASGRLIRVDLRPVTFPGQRKEQLQLGFSLFLPVGATGQGKRIQVTATHGLSLSDELELARGQREVNLLGRDAIGLGGAVSPRYEADVTLGYSERGLGVQLSGARRSRSFLGAASDTGILTFAPLTTFSLQAFAEGSRFNREAPALRNLRLGLVVNNFAGQRERVRDEQGSTPLAYQAVLRDPLGRTFELELRKSF